MKDKQKSNTKEEPKKIRKKDNYFMVFFSSVKLAVIVIFLIAISCILGTFIIQNRTTPEYVARFGKGWATFLEGGQFTQVFHSYWFTVLLVLLCMNLLVCAIRRWRNTIMQMGFLATHLSLILIMAGSLVDGWLGASGAVNMLEGQSIDYYYTFDDQTRRPLGFEVFLEDFELEKHAPKFELISYVKEKDKERKISANEGDSHSIKPYKVAIKKFIPDAKLDREPINTSKEEKSPAVYVQMYNSGQIEAEGWLIAKSRYWYDNKRADIRFEYIWAKTEAELDNLVKLAKETGKADVKGDPALIVNIKDSNIKHAFPLNIGEHYVVPKSEYHVIVDEVTNDFSNRNLPPEKQVEDNPAIKVTIHGPEGDESRWVFAQYPDWDEMHATKYGNVKLLYETAGSDQASIGHLVKLIQYSKGDNRFLYLNNGKLVADEILELDKMNTIGNSGYQIKLTKYFSSFGFREEVVQNSENMVNPAIFVDVEGPLGKQSDWLFAKDQGAWWSEDKGFALLYQEEREMIKDFKSTLKIIDNGVTVKTKTIEVNDPISYKGFDFYQSNYDPDNPRFSGIQITSHPGIPVVYAGFIILCLGIVFIFYIKPFIKRARKNKNKRKEGVVNE